MPSCALQVRMVGCTCLAATYAPRAVSCSWWSRGSTVGPRYLIWTLLSSPCSALAASRRAMLRHKLYAGASPMRFCTCRFQLLKEARGRAGVPQRSCPRASALDRSSSDAAYWR